MLWWHSNSLIITNHDGGPFLNYTKPAILRQRKAVTSNSTTSRRYHCEIWTICHLLLTLARIKISQVESWVVCQAANQLAQYSSLNPNQDWPHVDTDGAEYFLVWNILFGLKYSLILYMSTLDCSTLLKLNPEQSDDTSFDFFAFVFVTLFPLLWIF